jgi:hypothetical protein
MLRHKSSNHTLADRTATGQSPLLNEPFFYVKKIEGRFQIKGTPSCFLGHRIKAAGATPSEGVFAEWLWDGQCIRLKTDGHGFYPIYYFVRENEFGVSSSIPVLLALGAPTDLDYSGLAVFLRIGFFIREDTPFKFIRALPPNANLTWSPAKIDVVGALPLGKFTQMDRSTAIDGYVELFRAAIRRRLPPNEHFAVTLSGGKDSRHILLELCHAGFKPKVCVTVGTYLYSENQEARIASELAASVNVSHEVIDQEQSPFLLELEKNRITNFCADEHGWLLAVAAHLDGKVSTIYDGLGGSIFCEGFRSNKERQRLAESGDMKALADDVLGQENALLMLKPAELKKVSREIALDHLTAELRRHAQAPNPVCSFFFWNRTRRQVSLSPYRIFNRFETVFSPFTDHALTEHLSSLPGSMVLDHTFHTDTIARAFPRHAHMPFAKKPEGRTVYSKAFMQFAWDVVRFSYENGRSSFISQSWLYPRLIRCLLDKNYSSAILWIGPFATYLLQLERLRRQAGKASRHNVMDS